MKQLKTNNNNHMKSIIKYSILTLLLTFTLVSCEDYLERYPLNNPSDATFISNETELNIAVTGCYNKLFYNEQYLPFHLSLDVPTDIGWDRNGTSPLLYLGNGSGDSRNLTVVSVWTNLYTGIARCNYVLTNMDRCIHVVPENIYNERKAEVRFLRALYYHYLIELYGGVPLVIKPLALSESQMKRNTKEEVVNFILKELEECASDLPLNNNPTSGKIHKSAAWALASRIALYNEKWDTSISNAQKVMDLEGSQVELHSNYMDLFQYAGEQSKEIIFSIQYTKGVYTHVLYTQFASRNGGGYSGRVPSYQLADSWECTDGLQIDKSDLFDPQNPYKNRDPRLGYTLAVSGSEFLGYQFETHGDSIYCWNYSTNPPYRTGNKEATHAYATFTGICWRKYADIIDKSDKWACELNTVVIRYAEVLLNYAEAKIEAGSIDQTVLDAINKVRQRPTVEMPPLTTTDQNELRFAVRRERKYELSGEGLRLFDIRRWEIADRVMNLPVLGRMKKSYPSIAPRIDEYGTSYYDDIPVAQPGESADFKMRLVEHRKFDKNRDYLWPIPYIEMDTNKEMEQNNGYAN